MIELAVGHRLGDLEIDLSIRSSARTLALFGDSGAGKTSVLNAIAGLLLPASGRIALDGIVLFDRALGVCLPPRRRRIGYVFQEGRLFPHLDVRGNLLYGAGPDTAERRGDFAALVELLALDALLERRPPTLSGGERQRVAIGRALLSKPHALLLDEPLTGLHAEARQQVLGHLRRLKHERGVLTVLVSHRADEVAALADDVVWIESGRAVGQTTVAEFARRHGLAPGG